MSRSSCCYYELLGLERNATQEEIKKAFRLKAFQHHPDKNPDNIQESTSHFILLQRAYDVLADVKERAWYDSHRESIIGSTSSSSSTSIVQQIYAYFSSTAYADMSDAEDAFYTTYRNVFERVVKFERDNFDFSRFSRDDFDLHFNLLQTSFSFSNTPYQPTVHRFYSNWTGFSSKATFSFTDRFNPDSAENRKIKRSIDRENKRVRDEERRKFTEAVRSLVMFVKKRDLRVIQQPSGQQHASQVKMPLKKRDPIPMQSFDSEFEDSLNRIEQDIDDDLNWFCFACKLSLLDEHEWSDHLNDVVHKINALKLREEMEQEFQREEKQKENTERGKAVKQKSKQRSSTESMQKAVIDDKKDKMKRREERLLKKESKALTCSKCNVIFDSRNKLFTHLKEEQHAFFQSK